MKTKPLSLSFARIKYSCIQMKLPILLLTASIGSMGFSHAAYISVDDFESYTVGHANGGGSDAFVNNSGPWTGWNGSAAVGSSLINIATEGGSEYLRVGYTATGLTNRRGAYKSVTSIDNNASGNYYFQLRTSDSAPNASYGLTDVSAPVSGWDDFEVQVSLVEDTVAGDGTFKLTGRSGGSELDLVAGLAVSTWYDIWLVVDNATDTFDVYQGTTGSAETLGTLVGSDLAFRNGTTDALSTFAVLSENIFSSSAHLDNISYAIPEPSTYGLLAGCFALTSVMVRRRR